MELGMVGLGRMGLNMVRRLEKAGHHCVAWDRKVDVEQSVVKDGACGTTSLEELVGKLAAPRVVWLMVSAAVVDTMLEQLVPLLQADDVVIDGGNSYYHDDIRRAAELKPKGIHYVDVRCQQWCVGELSAQRDLLSEGSSGEVEAGLPCFSFQVVEFRALSAGLNIPNDFAIWANNLSKVCTVPPGNTCTA
jgi:6-phosphogluconate dehydrogenase (decarboxylating)